MRITPVETKMLTKRPSEVVLFTGNTHFMIYFDNNSTTRLSEKVEKFVKNELTENFANASSEHLFGQKEKKSIDESREYISSVLGVLPKSLIFTSGATESAKSILNLESLKEYGIKNIITSNLEHHATLNECERLERSGFKIFRVQNDSNGMISCEHLKLLVKANPKSLVTILGANNETGVLQDIPKLTSICKEYGCLVFLDAVQMLGKSQFNLNDFGVDFASFSAHKIGGLKGVGALYIANRESFSPFMIGGGQEGGLRGGTYNAAGIKTFSLALKDAQNWNLEAITRIREQFEEKILLSNQDIVINCKNSNRICNTSNIYFPKAPNQAVVMDLSVHNIFISTGSACSSGSIEPSHVIKGLGKHKSFATHCLRFSFAHFNDIDEVTHTLAVLRKLPF